MLVHLRGVEGESIFDVGLRRETRLVGVEGWHILLVVQHAGEGGRQEMLGRVTLSETLNVHFRHVMMLG